jgi:peptide subunit release factor 1 (eRF1)
MSLSDRNLEKVSGNALKLSQQLLCVCAREPIDRISTVVASEDAKFWVGEMRRDLRRNFQKRTIGKYGDTRNAFVVIARKPHVLDKRREILPTRHVRDGQQNAS